jgi:EamA domain-containing membrane protein RarD
MDNKTEGTMAVIAALIVLLSAMWDARVSVAVSLVALVGFGLYKLVQKKSR